MTNRSDSGKSEYTATQRLFLDITKELANLGEQHPEADVLDIAANMRDWIQRTYLTPDKFTTPAPMTLPPLWIGITGRTGSGKDTLANTIRDVLRSNKQPVIIKPLAEDLKRDVVDMLYDWLHSYHKEKLSDIDRESLRNYLDGGGKQDVGRPLYQGFGEFVRQWAGLDYWIKQVEQQRATHTGAVFITPDVRYTAEAEAFKLDPYGVLLRTEASNRRSEKIRHPDHASEQGITRCMEMADITVPGHITLDKLPEWVHHVLLPTIVVKYHEKQRILLSTGRPTGPIMRGFGPTSTD